MLLNLVWPYVPMLSPCPLPQIVFFSHNQLYHSQNVPRIFMLLSLQTHCCFHLLMFFPNYYHNYVKKSLATHIRLRIEHISEALSMLLVNKLNILSLCHLILSEDFNYNTHHNPLHFCMSSNDYCFLRFEVCLLYFGIYPVPKIITRSYSINNT